MRVCGAHTTCVSVNAYTCRDTCIVCCVVCCCIMGMLCCDAVRDGGVVRVHTRDAHMLFCSDVFV